MKVIAEGKHSWLLFENKGKLLFDVNCSHSFVGYSFMMYLNSQEEALYEVSGSDFLDQLAKNIDISSPISRTSNSQFKDRYLGNKYSKESLKAYEKWRQQSEG